MYYEINVQNISLYTCERPHAMTVWHTKNSKNHKKWYYSPSHRLIVNVLLNNVIFVAVFDVSLWCDVLYIYICCFITITKFLCWWSIIINHLLSTAIKTLNLKYFRITILIFRSYVTSSEPDHRTRREHFPIGGQWWPCVYLARIRRYRYGASKILGSRVWPFGHVTSSVTWSLYSAYVVSYWCSIVTMHLSCTVTEVWGPKDIGVMTLTFWGQVTSSITWPSDSAWALSYWWSMITMRLSCADTEIRNFKDFGVTSLTFWGHVTSSVTVTEI